DAVNALVRANEPATFFIRASVPNRLRTDPENGRPYFEVCQRTAMRGILARVADWIKVQPTKDGTKRTPAVVPYDVVDDLLSLPGLELPPVRAITETPVFVAGGKLVSSPGYHRDTLLWLHS